MFIMKVNYYPILQAEYLLLYFFASIPVIYVIEKCTRKLHEALRKHAIIGILIYAIIFLFLVIFITLLVVNLGLFIYNFLF